MINCFCSQSIILSGADNLPLPIMPVPIAVMPKLSRRKDELRNQRDQHNYTSTHIISSIVINKKYPEKIILIVLRSSILISKRQKNATTDETMNYDQTVMKTITSENKVIIQNQNFR